MVFDAYSRYYDLLYQDKDYFGEVDYIEGLLRSHGLTGCNLLEFGSGTGRHGRIFAERGYQVRGIERSPEMVGQAQQTPGFVCEQGDICTIQLGRTFDAVLSLFHVISYQISNQNVRSVFARAAEHIKPGGLFVFDVWHTPAVYIQRPCVRFKRLLDEDISILRVAEPVIYYDQNRVDVNYTIIATDLSTGISHSFEENHSMRHFSIPELDLFAEGAGFELLTAEEWLTGALPSEASWGVCLVLRKK